MRRLMTILCLLVWNLFCLHAQNHVMASGADFTGTNGIISYSAGQIDYITVKGQDAVLTEGLQQPSVLQLIAGNARDGINLDAVVYPNPASSYVELKFNEPVDQSLNYRLTDINGRVLASDQVSEPITRISLPGLPTGTYYLVILQKKEVIRTYRINTFQ
ncbi:MAG TPA: T9SS type A sorting domain-containing protein [Saprospiraceae bacterium]|nr:T9SS type A sorting domain-containing protein [Saprospiraceae bacterium]